jgi:hypothetical protein
MGSKQKLAWSPNHKKRYNWLFNEYQKIKPNANIDDYIAKSNKRQLLTFINNNKEWSDSSKESFFFMIARWLQLNKPNDTNITTFQQAGYNLKQKRDEKEGENQLDDKEKESFRDHDYFLNLISSIDPATIKTQTEHFKYLLLNLLVKQPPLRTSFYTSAKFITNLKGFDTKQNYVYIHFIKDVPFVTLVVHKDKVSQTKSYSDYKYSDVDIKDADLVKLIHDSYEKYPRTYLFENKGTPIKQDTLLKYLKNVTKVPGMTVDIMRSSYITYFYEKNKTYKAREALSRVMRHSQPTAQKNYLKIVEQPQQPKDSEIASLKEENNKLLIKIAELEDKLKKLQPDDQLYNRRRRDIIYKLNSGKTKAKQDTLSKYEIKYDETTKLYI